MSYNIQDSLNNIRQQIEALEREKEAAMRRSAQLSRELQKKFDEIMAPVQVSTPEGQTTRESRASADFRWVRSHPLFEGELQKLREKYQGITVPEKEMLIFAFTQVMELTGGPEGPSEESRELSKKIAKEVEEEMSKMSQDDEDC